MRQIRLLLAVQAAEWKKKKTVLGLIGIVLIVIIISTISHVKNQETTQAALPLKIELGVANEDDSEYAKLLITYFTENENFSSYVNVVQEKEETLKEWMLQGKLDAYLVIPPLFAESLMEMEHLPMQAVVSMRQPTKALIFKHALNAYETYIKNVEISCSVLYDRMRAEGFTSKERSEANMEISLDLIFTALGKDEFFRKRVVEAEQETSLTEHYSLVLFFFAGTFLCFPAGFRILKLKQNKMIQRMKTMHLSMAAVVLATILPYALFLACFVSLVLVVRGQWEMKVFLTAFLLLLLMLSMVVFFGSILKKRKDYLFAFSILIMVLAILGGSIVPKGYLPDAFETMAVALPNDRFVSILTGQVTKVMTTVLASLAGCLVMLFSAGAVLSMRGEGSQNE